MKSPWLNRHRQATDSPSGVHARATRTRSARTGLLLVAVLAAGCALRRDRSEPDAATPPAATEEAAPGVIARTGQGASEAVSAARTTTREGLPEAATAPLEDLNITRNEIPESLKAIAYVYTAYPPPDCDVITEEIARLDVDLGRDYDNVAEEDESLGERGGEAVGDLVVDTIRGVTTDVIPFRSVVREVSGAAAFDRRRARAFAAGYARRAYLKGLALGQGCAPPAAPLVIVPPVVEDEASPVEQRSTREAPVNPEWEPVAPAPTP